MMNRKVVDVIIKVLMKQGGLSDFDYEFVERDALAIVRRLKKLGYTIKKED